MEQSDRRRLCEFDRARSKNFGDGKKFTIHINEVIQKRQDYLSDILLSHTTDEFDCLHESMAQLHKVMVEHEQQN